MKTRSNKFVVSMMLVLTMVFTTISPLFTVQAAAPIPTALSSNVHPRVLFTAEDIDSIKAVVEDNIAERETSEYSSARAYFKRRADVRAEDGTDNGDPDNHNDGWNEKKLAGIEAKALAYVLREDVYNTSIKKSGRNTGYEELGARAVQYLKKYLETIDMSDVTDDTSRSRNSGEILRVVAEVYDWCYDLFDKPIQKVAVTVGEETPAEGQTVTVTKAEIRNLVNTKLLPHFEMGSNFKKQGGMVGHGTEAQLLRDGLSWAIAVYGEDQSVWNNVATRFYNEYVPIRNHFLPSAWNLQGTEYGFYRNQWDAWSYLLITGMGAESPYNVDAIEGLGDTALGITYSRRPDGQFFRDGDVPITSNEYFSKWTKYNTAFLDAAVAQNPYVYGEYVETKPSGQSFYEDTAVPILVMAGRSGAALAKTTPKATKNLPLTKFFGGKLILCSQEQVGAKALTQMLLLQ